MLRGDSSPPGGTADGLQQAGWEQGAALGTKAETERGKGQQDPVRGERDRLTAAEGMRDTDFSCHSLR